MGDRVAVLLIHGIGQQRPYDTLDHFARGLLTSYGAEWTIAENLELSTDAALLDQKWVRAVYSISPAAPAPFESDPAATLDEIALYEYYWAPITQDKITYTRSLLFLIQAGFRPFLYLASNISILWAAQKKRIFYVIVKELFRLVCLFLPLLLLFGIILYLLSVNTWTSFAKQYTAATQPSLMASAALVAIRYLYLFTIGSALLQSVRAPSGWQRSILWRASLLFGIAFYLTWPLWIGSAFAKSAGLFRHYLPLFSRALAAFAALLPHPSFSESFGQNFKIWLFLNPSLAAFTPALLTLGIAVWVRFILVDYIGDVAVYVTSDRFASSYKARSQILQQCTDTLLSILLSRDKNGKATYDRVLIVGHSLGSVIAYDTLNQVRNRARSKALDAADLERLRGLVTFGSPLNKIIYFFRDQSDQRQVLRAQTIETLFGFRLLRQLLQVAQPQFQPNPGWSDADRALAQGFRWINAYSLQDPISGKLSFYEVEEQCGFNNYWVLYAHMQYWDDSRFYKFVRRELL